MDELLASPEQAGTPYSSALACETGMFFLVNTKTRSDAMKLLVPGNNSRWQHRKKVFNRSLMVWIRFST